MEDSLKEYSLLIPMACQITFNDSDIHLDVSHPSPKGEWDWGIVVSSRPQWTLDLDLISKQEVEITM